MNVITIFGYYISIVRITSPDSAEPPPDDPLHQRAEFPTPTGISQQTAYNWCSGAINGTEIYESCLNLTEVDTGHYVRSCVEDIKVTVPVCHAICFICNYLSTCCYVQLYSLYFTYSFVFHCTLSLYVVLIDVLIYSAAQLQECLINLLTYLLNQLIN